MSTWKGISHARMTSSMRALSGGEYKVLAAVRRLIPDGKRRKLSQLDIADRAGVSEGTVSSAMRSLEGAYIRRYFLGRGRGNGYEIEVLPPPERRDAQPVSAPTKGSNPDLSQRSFFSGIGEPQTPPEKTSDLDPSIFYDHDHEQQQQQAGQSEQVSGGDSGQAIQPSLAPETAAALAAAGAHPVLIQRVAKGNPGCTPTDVAAALAAAPQKPNSHTPPGLAFECLARGQQVIVPRPRAEPAPVQPSRPRGRSAEPRVAFDPNEARAQIAALGGVASPPPNRRDIETAPDLSEAECAPWLERFDAASDTERADVVHAFWTWWGEREQARKLAPPAPPDEAPAPVAAPPPVAPPGVLKLSQVWQAALGSLQTKTSRQEFDTWLWGTTLSALDGGTATITAASPFHREGLEGRYRDRIARAIGDVIGRPVQLRIVAGDGTEAPYGEY